MIKFLDTNALLEIDKNELNSTFYISSITLLELEDIKTNRHKDESVKHKVREAIRFIDGNDNCKVIVYKTSLAPTRLRELELEETPDFMICACASIVADKDDIEFVTDDLLCKNIAKNYFDLNVGGVNHTEGIYKGYKRLNGNTAYINDMMLDPAYLDLFSNNEYIIIHNSDTSVTSEMRFINGAFVPLKLPPSRYIKGKNSLQRCALYILNNNDITIAAILGGYGSGKTFLSMSMALYHVKEKGNQSKILGIREARGEGVEIGYLPGDFDNKTDSFFLPLVQQLDGGEFEFESLKQRGILESNIPFYLKGTTYNETILLVDEAEDLTQKQVKLIGTRVGQNSRIFFSGDYKQSVIRSDKTNAIVKMCNEFKGNNKFGCIYLGEDVRSETSKMFAGLYE